MADVDQLKRDLWKRMSHSPFVMVGLEGSAHSEPLTAQLDEDQVDTLFFFVAKDNRLARGGAAVAQFVSKGHDFFACLAGDVLPTDDPALIGKLWSKPVEAWFPGGKDDPNLALLRFDIRDAELWETEHDPPRQGQAAARQAGRSEGRREPRPHRHDRSLIRVAPMRHQTCTPKVFP